MSNTTPKKRSANLSKSRYTMSCQCLKALWLRVYKPDVAVVDPANKEHYLLGIICDGHNYYRLKTARDREVVQPTVLRMLGWKLMHVWTVDWMLRSEIIIDMILLRLFISTCNGVTLLFFINDCCD